MKQCEQIPNLSKRPGEVFSRSHCGYLVGLSIVIIGFVGFKLFEKEKVVTIYAPLPVHPVKEWEFQGFYEVEDVYVIVKGRTNICSHHQRDVCNQDYSYDSQQ